MGNPRNRTLDRRSFTASYADENAASGGAITAGDPGTEDICTRRKRVRFAQGTDSSLEPESDAKAKLSDGSETEVPKTSEYAFFKKLRHDAGKTGLAAHKENHIRDESKPGDGSGGHNAGVGNIISQSFQNLKFSLHAQDVRPTESSSLPSPIAGLPKATDMNSLEQLDCRNPEFSHPVKKATHVNFEISCSPFRDRVRSAVASYAYGQGNIFSTKRDKLLQLIANTYPESKDLGLNGVDLVNSMLGRLFPNSYDSKHKLTKQDTCTSWPHGFPENSADCGKFRWSGHCGSREAWDMMLLDYGCTSSGSTELAKWSGDYSMSPDWSSDNEHTHYKMRKPYHISDYVRSRSPWKKYHPPHLPCEPFVSYTLSDMVSHQPDDLPSRQNLLLGWVDEKTEDEDQLQIAPYKFDCGINLDSNFQTLRKNDYQLRANSGSSLSRIPPQFVSSHYGDMDSYFKTIEETDNYVASNHLLDDRENKSWDIIHSHSSGSYFINKDTDSNLPYMSNHLLGTPNIFATQELIPSGYPRGQIMCLDQPWEVCKEVTCSNYLSHGCHSYTDGGYQIGYTDKPSYDQTIHPIFPDI